MPAIATPRKVGRPLTANSVRMSEAIFKRRFVKGEKLQDIADSYNAKFSKNGENRTMTAQAVQGRIDRFRAKYPEKVAEILGSIPAPVEAPVESPAEAELVTA